MKNFINLVKKYKLYILSVLLVIFFFRSCSKSAEIKRLNRDGGFSVENIDSLQTIINKKEQKIDSFPELLRVEKINIHLEYDGWISSKDRGPQLMELHPIVKNNIKESQKK
tara:strand:- start:380 stop:712 length:333 start_codon:yes stop_codon:yes gene_type:complete